ncbi:MAG: cation-translocating P-type ATPase C-terminal domain-containing protein, partial [Candidatus Uhrbacteria bacterium]|nr:cation-translocating P-type ATPase C-terminal domain-containing protein [Candidatus Uhrbacteria bacterium]
EAIVVMGAMTLGFPVPLLPLHILWINFVTDGLPSMALAFEPIETGVMDVAPRQRSTPLLSGSLRRLVAVVAVCTSIVFIVALVWLESMGDPIFVRTWIFVALGLVSTLVAFVFRVFRSSLFTSRPWRNMPLIGMAAIGISSIVLPVAFEPLRLLLGFSQLSSSDWLYLVSFVGAVTIIIDLTKILAFRRKRSLAVLSSPSIWTSQRSKTSKMPS